MDPDTEGLFEVVSLVAGATAIVGSYLLQYWYDITTKGALNLMTVPQFRNFGPQLKKFLSTQPNQSSAVLIEGSVKQLVLDMVTHVSLGYHVVDHHNVHRLVLGLLSPKDHLIVLHEFLMGNKAHAMSNSI